MKTEDGYYCKLLRRKVSVMLRPCLREYEKCPIFKIFHPKLEVLFKCLSHSLPLEGFETEKLMENFSKKKLPWEANGCDECACFSETYNICLYDLVKHRGRCPVKERLERIKRG